MEPLPCVILWSMHWRVRLINILLLGCCARFLCTLIMWCSQLASIKISPIYPFPLTLTAWTTWPINKVHIYKLNWREILPCQYIHVLYPISIVMRLCAVLSYLSSIFSINMHISPKQGYCIQRKIINLYQCIYYSLVVTPDFHVSLFFYYL